MLVFSRLFKFDCMSANLEDLSNFRFINIYSFFGLIPEGVGIIVSFLIIPDYRRQLTIFYPLLDVIIVFLISIILALAINWKPKSFF